MPPNQHEQLCMWHTQSHSFFKRHCSIRMYLTVSFATTFLFGLSLSALSWRASIFCFRSCLSLERASSRLSRSQHLAWIHWNTHNCYWHELVVTSLVQGQRSTLIRRQHASKNTTTMDQSVLVIQCFYICIYKLIYSPLLVANIATCRVVALWMTVGSKFYVVRHTSNSTDSHNPNQVLCVNMLHIDPPPPTYNYQENAETVNNEWDYMIV